MSYPFKYCIFSRMLGKYQVKNLSIHWTGIHILDNKEEMISILYLTQISKKVLSAFYIDGTSEF